MRIETITCESCGRAADVSLSRAADMSLSRSGDVCYDCRQERRERGAELARREYAEYMEGDGRHFDSNYVMLLAMREMLGIDEEAFWRKCLTTVRQLKERRDSRFNAAMQRRGEIE